MNHLTFSRKRRSLRAWAGAVAALVGFASVGLASVASSEPVRRSGYAIGTETCGSADLAFPRIQIDMKAGFCAGLVASEEDRLKFPRAIIQSQPDWLHFISKMKRTRICGCLRRSDHS